ncbi:MAG TPA: terminase small subunit [Cytophagales bacterium]|nr:terminase small subunit [Cytophagales bacterium]
MEQSEEKKSKIAHLLPYQFKEGNKGSLKMYQSKEQLLEEIEKYFLLCAENKKPLTITGLALSLGFGSRQSLIRYQKEAGYEEFHSIVEWAKMRIESSYEEMLVTRPHVAGLIFNMKNNFGYSDKIEIEATANTSNNVENLSEEEKLQMHKLLNKAKNVSGV